MNNINNNNEEQIRQILQELMKIPTVPRKTPQSKRKTKTKKKSRTHTKPRTPKKPPITPVVRAIPLHQGEVFMEPYIGNEQHFELGSDRGRNPKGIDCGYIAFIDGVTDLGIYITPSPQQLRKQLSEYIIHQIKLKRKFLLDADRPDLIETDIRKLITVLKRVTNGEWGRTEDWAETEELTYLADMYNVSVAVWERENSPEIGWTIINEPIKPSRNVYIYNFQYIKSSGVTQGYASGYHYVVMIPDKWWKENGFITISEGGSKRRITRKRKYPL